MIKNNRHRPVDEQLEIHEVKLENAHRWVVLKGTPKARIGKYEHETAKADLYVAFGGCSDEWSNEFSLGGGALVTDVSSLFRGTRIHFEVDLGNMEPERLFHKVERYVQCAGPGEKVVFALRDGKYKAGVIGTQLMDYCANRKLGKFITATLLENFCEFPLADVLITPWKERINVTQLIG
jgi:hypothetical protein